jgi:predicted molibdopterin-dependent oxidoreductase YjgC
VRVESPRGQLEAKARISGIREGLVFVPFHYGYFDSDGLNGHRRAANELTITEWDPASKQPLYKVGAARVTKISGSGDTPPPAPTTTASAPISDDSMAGTVGARDTEVRETMGKAG